MKSFCVLNSAVTAAAGEKIGAAAAKVLGGKLGVLYCGSDASFATAQNIAKGIKRQGGCALLAGDAFQAQTAFACGHYSLDGAFFISGDKKCSITVCGADGRKLSEAQEDEIAGLVSKDKLSGHRGGFVTQTDLNCAYYRYLLDVSQNLEGISATVKSPDILVKTALVRVLLALGGENKGRNTFFLSASGQCVSAVDECGKIRTRDELLSVLYALRIVQEKVSAEISFSLHEGLDTLAKENGVKIRRSFTGGNDIFATDCVLLTVMLMKYMSQKGCGLNELCKILPETAVSRKTISSTADIQKIADAIECDQLVTDGSSFFARVGNGNILLTPSAGQGRYCLEVQAADSETAREIALNLTDLYI